MLFWLKGLNWISSINVIVPERAIIVPPSPLVGRILGRHRKRGGTPLEPAGREARATLLIRERAVNMVGVPDVVDGWANQIAEKHGYSVRFVPVGTEDANVGSPTQMAVFSMSPRR